MMHGLKFGAVFAAMMLLACCGWMQKPDAGVRMTLNFFSDTVGPASKLAYQSCSRAEQLVPAQIRAGAMNTTQGETRLKEVQQRCDVIRGAFDKIRELHGTAVRFVEENDLDNAKVAIEQARERFRSLQSVLEEP